MATRVGKTGAHEDRNEQDIMEILVYYILFISAAIIVASCVNINKKPSPDQKLLDNMNKLDKIYERNPDTGKMRSRKTGDYNNNSPYEPINNGSKYYK